jgi:uncharacterized membrane protein AbrB (regulator of aidB expression)
VSRTRELQWHDLSTMKWKFFLSASILVGGLLIKFGVPLSAVIGGIALAAIMTWKQSRGPWSGPRAGR